MSTVASLESAATANAVQQTESSTKKTKVNGRTIGEPKLSEKAAKYYEQLKKKYSNLDFILVSKDKKEQAQAQAGSYANANRMVVLIDEEKIEKMAEDETYRKQYEGIIRNAASGLSQLQSKLSGTAANIKSYGIKINDNGTASLFAVIDKSLAQQKERIEKKAEENRLEKKKAEKEESKKQLEESQDTVTVTASSVDELIRKINDVVYAGLSDGVFTEEEKQYGQNIDFRM